MQSLIHFVMGLNLNFSSVFVILDEYRGIMNKRPLNSSASLLPWVLFVVKLESDDKHDHLIDI
jgi:hypothetical protein